MEKISNPSKIHVMKTIKLFVIIMMVSIGYPVLSQNSIFPGIDVYSLEGSRVSARDILRNDLPVVIVFWNSDDRNSLDQLRMVNEEYESGLKGKNVKIVGICTDYSGSFERIRPLVYGIGLDFEVYIDKNNDLKRAMNVTDIPCTILINAARDVYKYSGYCANVGDLINGAIDKSLAKNNDSR